MLFETSLNYDTNIWNFCKWKKLALNKTWNLINKYIKFRYLFIFWQFLVGVLSNWFYCFACARESWNVGQGSHLKAHFVLTNHLLLDASSRYPLSHHYMKRVGYIGKRKTTSYAKTPDEEQPSCDHLVCMSTPAWSDTF